MNTFPSLQVCTICLDTDNKLHSISDSLGSAYDNLIGQSLCNGEEIRRYLCSECVYTLASFSRFRDKSLRALSVMEELAEYYSVVTLEHIKLIDRQTCQLTSRLSRTATKQDHCDLYIKHSDKNDAQDITGVVVVKNESSDTEDTNILSQYSDVTDENELTNIGKQTECETEQHNEDNVNIKSEISGHDEIDFGSTNNNDDFSVDPTLDLEKQNDGVSNIGKQKECETEQNYQDNVNIKTEISGKDEIDLGSRNNIVNFSVDHTLDLEKQNDGLINIDKQTEWETEQDYEDNVNIKSEISENDETNFESRNNDVNFAVDHTLDLEKQNDLLSNIGQQTECETEQNYEDNVGIKSEIIHENDDIHFESTNNNFEFSADCTLILGKEKIVSKTRKKLQDKLVFETKDTLIGEELKKSKKTSHRKLSVNKLESKKVNCEKNTTICKKSSNFKRNPKKKSIVNSELKYDDQNNLLIELKQKPDIKPYSCKTCGFKCKLKISLSVHKKTHKGETKFTCTVCDYKCKQRAQLKTHMSKHTDQKSFKCEMCPSTFKFKNNLSRHMKEHTCKNPFKCDMCEYTAVRKERFLTHMRIHTGEKLFTCRFCPSKYLTKMSLIKHEMWTHTESLQMNLNEENTYKRHEIEKRPMDINVSKEQTFQSVHLEHLKTHSGEKFKCATSGPEFSQDDSLKKHILTHTSEKQYACKLCDYIGSDLKRHIRTHTGERPYACTYCGRSFSKSYTLTTHLRTHTGEKPFSCDICHYKCTRTSQLVRHLRTHTGEKPFSCELCDFKCTRHCNLLQHTRKHTGRMLSCDYCSYRTTLKNSLVVHIKRHMDIIKWGKTRKPRARKSVAI